MRGCASRKGPQICHLLFVDDCNLFGEATVKGVLGLKQILKEYKGSSGQCMNFENLIVYFSSNTTEVIRNQISNALGVQ